MASTLGLGVASDRAAADVFSNPIRLGLESQVTKDAVTVGGAVAKPFRLTERLLLLGQVYAAKGDSDFGILSGGLALRRRFGDSSFAGINVFYDALQDSNGFSYSQIGFGAELSRGRWTLRGNGYLPVGDHEESRTSTRRWKETNAGAMTESAEGTSTSFTTTAFTERDIFRRTAAWSWEVELEVALRKSPGFVDPRLAVGYYQVAASHSDEHYSGLKLRGELRVGEHFVADLEWRQDSRGLGEEWRGVVGWEFLLGAPRRAERESAVAARMARSSDGKTMVDPKSAPVPVPAAEAIPPGFDLPVHRTPWPRVLGSHEAERFDPKRTTRVLTLAPHQDCGCKSGPPLIYD